MRLSAVCFPFPPMVTFYPLKALRVRNPTLAHSASHANYISTLVTIELTTYESAIRWNQVPYPTVPDP